MTDTADPTPDETEAVEPLAGNTAHGYPYPSPTDPVSLGAANIQALADAIEKRLATVSATIPAAPVDGQLWYYPMDAAKGVVWVFRYRAASPSAYKWEFVGGPPLWLYNAGPNGVAAATWTAFPPSFTAPFAGDYLISTSVRAAPPAAAQIYSTAWVAGAPMGSYTGTMVIPSGDATTGITDAPLLGLTAGQVINLACWSNVNATLMSAMVLVGKPIRVG